MEFMYILWDFLVAKKTSFQSLISWTWLSAGRPDRSTVAEVGRPVQSTDVHRRAHSHGLVGRSTGRSTVQRALLSRNGPDRPAESCCSLYPVLVDLKGKTALSCCQQADLFSGYKYFIPWLFWIRF